MDIDQTTQLMFEKVQDTISRHLEETPTEIETPRFSFGKFLFYKRSKNSTFASSKKHEHFKTHDVRFVAMTTYFA